MRIFSAHQNRWANLAKLLLPAAVALLFLAFTFSYYPFRERIQFDTDEGLNLMRSMLVVLGHPLYGEVSSDQAPLFTHILGFLFRAVGFEVNPARMLVLLFSALLVWSCAQFLQLTWGSLSTLLFLILIVMVPRYLELSVSVMIGVPAIALAALSMLCVTLWHQSRRPFWLALSGFALALSVLTKLFTGFLAPIFLIGITLEEYLRERKEGVPALRSAREILRPALVWGICFAGLTLLLGLVFIGPQHVGQLITSHLGATSEEDFQFHRFEINTHLRTAGNLLFLGYLGALFTVRSRRWLTFYPLAWAVLAYIILSFHSPVFYHHQLLVTIPVAILASAASGEGILNLFRLRRAVDLIRMRTLLAAGAVVGFILISSNTLPVLDNDLMDQPRISGFSLKATAGKLAVFRKMNEYASQTNWIVTDMPMYAFLVRRPVPPDLATFSRKRLVTGSLTDQDIIAAVEEYRPEQVLMARFEIPSFEAYLQKDYSLILSEENIHLFIRKDMEKVQR